MQNSNGKRVKKWSEGRCERGSREKKNYTNVHANGSFGNHSLKSTQLCTCTNTRAHAVISHCIATGFNVEKSSSCANGSSSTTKFDAGEFLRSQTQMTRKWLFGPHPIVRIRLMLPSHCWIRNAFYISAALPNIPRKIHFDWSPAYFDPPVAGIEINTNGNGHSSYACRWLNIACKASFRRCNRAIISILVHNSN